MTTDKKIVAHVKEALSAAGFESIHDVLKELRIRTEERDRLEKEWAESDVRLVSKIKKLRRVCRKLNSMTEEQGAVIEKLKRPKGYHDVSDLYEDKETRTMDGRVVCKCGADFSRIGDYCKCPKEETEETKEERERRIRGAIFHHNLVAESKGYTK